MRFTNLEDVQIAWDRLTPIAKDAYMELRAFTIRKHRVDDYSSHIWRGVLVYLERVESNTTPSDTTLRAEIRKLKGALGDILKEKESKQHDLLPSGN